MQQLSLLNEGITHTAEYEVCGDTLGRRAKKLILVGACHRQVRNHGTDKGGLSVALEVLRLVGSKSSKSADAAGNRD